MEGNSELSCLARKCMDFCRHLTKQGKAFTFFLSIGLSSSSHWTPSGKPLLKFHQWSLRRNLRWQFEHRQKKANPPSKTHSDEDIEKSGENLVENSEVIEEATDHK